MARSSVFVCLSRYLALGTYHMDCQYCAFCSEVYGNLPCRGM